MNSDRRDWAANVARQFASRNHEGENIVCILGSDKIQDQPGLMKSTQTAEGAPHGACKYLHEEQWDAVMLVRQRSISDFLAFASN